MPPHAPRPPLKRQRASVLSDSGSAVEQENAAEDDGVAPRGSNLLLRAHGAVLEENGRLRKEIDEKNERISDLEERNATLVAAQAPRTQKLHAEDIENVELRLAEVAALDEHFAERDARIAQLEASLAVANAAWADSLAELRAAQPPLAPPAPAAAGHDPKDEEERKAEFDARNQRIRALLTCPSLSDPRGRPPPHALQRGHATDPHAADPCRATAEPPDNLRYIALVKERDDARAQLAAAQRDTEHSLRGALQDPVAEEEADNLRYIALLEEERDDTRAQLAAAKGDKHTHV